MDDFGLFLQKNTSVSLTEKDQTFQGSKENIYQRKLFSMLESANSVTFTTLTVAFSLNAIFSWESWSYLKFVEIVLCLSGVGVVIMSNNLFASSKSTRSKPGRTSARTSSQSQTDYFPSFQLLLLIIMQEFTSMFCQPLSGGVLQWFSQYLIAAIVHIAFLDKYSKAKFSVMVRAGLQILFLLLQIRHHSLKTVLCSVVGISLGYFCLINSLYKFNKFLRSDFFQRDVQSKFLNQFYSTIDTMPYPVVVFDPVKADGEKGMTIVYFNFSGNDLIAGKERQLDSLNIDRAVNFLDLIDPQDEGTLLDNIELIRQDKSSYETMTSEIAKEILNSKIKMRFEITLWKMKWMERDVIAAMFNNDSYKNKKQESRFSSKFIEGLETMLNKNTEILDTAVANLKLYKEGKIQDPKVLYDQMSFAVADLMTCKLFNENLLLGEPWSKADELKTFNPRLMIVNIVDILSKDIKTKDIGLRVEFNRGFPQNLIETKAILLRSMIFNMIYYIQSRLFTGNILIQCDRQDREEEEDKSICNLTFMFKIESVRESDLPPRNFLVNCPGTTMTHPQLKPLPTSSQEAKLIGWLSFIKEELDIKVESYTTQNLEKSERQ